MKDFKSDINSILTDAYHNVMLMEETKRKYSSAAFTFRDRNAVFYLMNFEKGTNISDVAKHLKISRPSTTTLIKKLEKYGLVERVSDPDNDRSTIVRVTRKGEQYARAQKRYRDRMAVRVSEELTEEEKEILYRGLCKLNQFFVESINESEDKHK